MDSNLDLNIDNYSLEDILQLFRLSSDFDEADMKEAKKMMTTVLFERLGRVEK